MAYKIVKSSNNKTEPDDKCEVLIQSEADLSELPEKLAPGSVAYKADMSLIYMKDIDGSWKKIGG